ncbi:MAG: tetratricopeptide repeat protein [Anaerolineales bacterium]|jgi:tetratricopeptide (TPR) repeat protein
MTGREDLFQKAMNMGHSLAWDQQWEKAAAAYGQALEEFPSNPKALSSLGLALFELQRYDESLQVYQKAAQAAPNDPVPLENVGQISGRLGNRQTAIQSFLNAAELYIKNQDADKAITNWERVTHLDPEHVTAHSYLAMVHERIGHTQRAAAEYLMMASLVQRTGNAEKTAEIVKRAISLDPDSPEGHQAQILLKNGELLPKPTLPAGERNDLLLGQAKQQESPKIADTGLDPVEEAQKHAITRLAAILFDLTDAAGNLPAPKPALKVISPRAADPDPMVSERANIMVSIGQAIDFQSNDQDAQAAEELEKASAAGFTDPALSFDLGYLRTKGEQWESALKNLQTAVKDKDYTLGSHILLAQAQRQMGQLPLAVTESLEALKEADAQVVAPDQADGIRQLYEPLIEAQAHQTDTVVMEQVCDNVREILLRPNWRSAMLTAREQLPKSEEGVPPMPLGEILAQAQSGKVIEAMGKVKILARAGHLRSAMDEAFESFRYAPTFLPLHTLVGDLLLQEGRTQDAVSKYSVVAEAYGVRGEASQAVSLLRRIIQVAPMDMTVRTRLIDMLAGHGMIDEAVAEYIELANIYYRLAELDMARKTYTTALHLAQQDGANPTWSVKLMRRMVDIDMQRLDWRQALRIYEQLRTLEPNDLNVRKSLIELNIHLNQLPQATAELDGFLTYLESTGKRAEVIPFLEDMVKDNPKQGILRRALAEEFRQAERIPEAVTQLDALGNILLTGGDREGAIRILETILALNPPNSKDYQTLLVKIKTSV